MEPKGKEVVKKGSAEGIPLMELKDFKGHKNKTLEEALQDTCRCSAKDQIKFLTGMVDSNAIIDSKTDDNDLSNIKRLNLFSKVLNSQLKIYQEKLAAQDSKAAFEQKHNISGLIATLNEHGHLAKIFQNFDDLGTFKTNLTTINNDIINEIMLEIIAVLGASHFVSNAMIDNIHQDKLQDTATGYDSLCNLFYEGGFHVNNYKEKIVQLQTLVKLYKLFYEYPFIRGKFNEQIRPEFDNKKLFIIYSDIYNEIKQNLEYSPHKSILLDLKKEFSDEVKQFDIKGNGVTFDSLTSVLSSLCKAIQENPLPPNSPDQVPLNLLVNQFFTLQATLAAYQPEHSNTHNLQDTH